MLKFLITSTGNKYLAKLSNELFKNPHDKVVFDLLKDFVAKFKTAPTKENLLSYLEKHNIDSPELVTHLKAHIKSLYKDLPPEDHYNEALAVKEIQETLIKSYVINYTTSSSESKLEELYKSISSAVKLRQTAVSESTGAFLMGTDPLKIQGMIKGYELPWKTMQEMTYNKGFNKPELIIFLGGPKVSKTLILIELAVHFAMMGLDVFIADWENGVEAYLIRLMQKILNITEDQAEKKSTIRLFEEVKDKWKTFGYGQIAIEKFRATVDSVKTVEDYLINLDFKPGCIIWDYLDKVGSSKGQRDRRLISQEVYNDVMNLNSQLGCFSISISKVTGDPFAEFYTINDFAEDKEKAYNCHRSFAINRTEKEFEAGIMRVSPLVQRRGMSHRPDFFCVLKVDNEHQQLKEIIQ